MTAIFAIAQKDLRVLLRDRGALFWAGVFPLLFAVLFGAIFPSGRSERALAVAIDRDARGDAVASAMANNGVQVLRSTPDEGRARVRRGEAIAAVAFSPSPELAVDPTKPAESAAVESAITRAIAEGAGVAMPKRTIVGTPPRNGFELAFPAAVLWGLIGCAGAFAAATVAERRSGTHLRLRAAPVPTHALVSGKLLAVLVACAVDATALLAIARFAFDVRVERFAALPLAIFACAVCFAGITILLGVVGRTEQGVGGAAWATLLLLAMLGGAMVPLSVMPTWLRVLSDASPVKWGIVALEGATFRGLHVRELLPACAALVAFGLASLASGAAIARRAS